MSKVPMGQICMQGSCNNEATEKQDEMYYCKKHLNYEIKYIEGYIARDKDISGTRIEHDTHFFKDQPKQYHSAKVNCYSGSIFHIPELLNLKHGECRKVEIVITVLH